MGRDRLAAPHFYVQDAPKKPWHVETDEHCEYMLCGHIIPVSSETQRIRTEPPSRAYGCPDCWLKLRTDGEA